MPVSAFIKIEIYDITGRKIKTLVNEKKSAGRHTVAWKGLNDSNNYAKNGLYFYQITFSHSNNIVIKTK